MNEYDPRITPARGDLAAEHLRGNVTADRFVPGVVKEIIATRTGLARTSDGRAPLETELILGEQFTVYEQKGFLAWGQAGLDGYVGYISSLALGDPQEPPTHRLAVPASRGYESPSGKATAPWPLTLGSRLHVLGNEARFSQFRFGLHKAFVPSAHIKPVGEFVSDYVAVAEMFLGVPYLWGGRTSSGLDCSALVQLSLAESGIKAPRDSDQQREALGQSIGGAEALTQMRRGDLVFWKNHVAIALDNARMLHANALAMAVSIDEAIPFAQAVEATDGPVIAVKRLR